MDKIKIYKLNGTEITVNLSKDSTIGRLKKCIEKQDGTTRFKLYHKDYEQELIDAQTIDEFRQGKSEVTFYLIAKGSVLILKRKRISDRIERWERSTRPDDGTSNENININDLTVDDYNQYEYIKIRGNRTYNPAVPDGGLGNIFEKLYYNDTLRELTLTEFNWSEHVENAIVNLIKNGQNRGALAIGCTVVIGGLTKSPALNGKEATVVQRIKMKEKDASIEAYEVKIVETGEQKKLKRSNLIGGNTCNGALEKLVIGDYMYMRGSKCGKKFGDAIAINTILKELVMSPHYLYGQIDEEFIKSFSPCLRINQTLQKLDISKSPIHTGGQALAKALRNNTVMTELNIRDTRLQNSFMEIAETLPTMTALRSINILKNDITSDELKAIEAAFKENKTLKSICGASGTELDLSNQQLTNNDVKVVISELHNNKKLVSVNMLYNLIDTSHAKALVHTQELVNIRGRRLKSLCGNSGDETQLDMSGDYSLVWKDKRLLKNHGAIMLAPEIVANKSLTSLNISQNYICSYIGTGKTIKITYEPDDSNLYFSPHREGEDEELVKYDLSGLIALADAIGKNKSITSLNMSSNSMATKEAGAIIARMIRINSVLKELNLSSNTHEPSEYDIEYHNILREYESYCVGSVLQELEERFAQEFAAQLVDGMQGNRTLTSLNIRHNNIDEFACQKLQRLIDRNRNGERLTSNQRRSRSSRRRSSIRRTGQRFKSANSQRRTADAWFKRRMQMHNTKKVDDWMDRRMTIYEETKKRNTTVPS